MADSTILVANERYKSWSTNLTRLGSGALAYVVADVYIAQAIAPVLILPIAAGCLYAGWGICSWGCCKRRADVIQLSSTAAQAAPGIAALAIAAFAWLHYRRAKKAIERRARATVVGRRT